VDFELPDELAELQATVRKLAQERVAPRAREIDETEEYPDDLFALFVEAGLTGVLALAGVSAGDAVLATLSYRLVSFWLPLPSGLLSYAVFRRRYRAELKAA